MEEALDEIGQLIEAEQLLTKDIYRDFVVDFKKREDGGEGTVPAYCP